ncbi:MAG: hypothetical protein WCG75_06075 [Armatimonadota bacterium]
MTLLVTTVVLCAIVFCILRYFRGSTIYFSNSSGGYTAYGDREVATQVSKDRYERILHSFIRQDIFDLFTVSQLQDPQAGVGMFHLNGKVEVNCSFLRLKTPEKVDVFRDAMKKLGYVPANEHPWNIGMGDQAESITITYQCAEDFNSLRDLVEHALELREGKSSGSFYVHVGRTQDLIGKEKVKVVPQRNLLDQVP